MKRRTGFVGNSSSCSYQCCICGNEQSGMDIDITDCGMIQTATGQVVCNEHISQNKIYDMVSDVSYMDLLLSGVTYNGNHTREEIEKDYKELPKDEFIDKYLTDFDKNWDAYDFPIQFTTLWTFDDVDTATLLEYLLMKHRDDVENIKKELKEKYKTYNALNTVLKDYRAVRPTGY
jgi:hypothetical protein